MTEGSARPRGVVPLTAAYFGFGAFWGSWSVVFIEFVASHGNTFSHQTWFLMCLTLSSMVGMILLSPRMVHLRPNLTLPLAVAFYGGGIALMPFLDGAWLLLAFAITGVGTGLIDVFVNQMGHQLEGDSGRSILQGIHAGYSIGTVTGALVAALILLSDGSNAWKVVLVFAALAQLPAFVMCLLEPAFRRGGGERAVESVSLSIFQRRPELLPTALIVVAAFFIEGSLDFWAVTYLRRTLGSGILAGAIGFAAFASAMAVGRLFAGKILFGMGYKRTILFSGFGSVIAGTLAIFAPNAWVAILAYLMMGFCLAAAGPAAFGSIPGKGPEAGVAIAAVTTVGYIGFVLGPPIMGPLADAAGVRSTIVVITLATLGILLGGYLSHEHVVLPGTEPEG